MITMIGVSVLAVASGWFLVALVLEERRIYRLSTGHRR